MHRTEMLVFRTDANYLFCHLDSVAVFGIETREESISLASLHHHHTEVVAFKHLIVSLLEGVSVALAFLGQDTCITLAALLLVRMTQVDNLDTVEVEVQL